MRLYKLFGYYGGGYALDYLIAGLPANEAPSQAGAVASWLAKATDSASLLWGAAAATAEFDHAHVISLLRLASQAAAHGDKQGGGLTPLESAVEELLKEIPWELAARTEDQLTPLQRAAKLGPVELRAAEEALLASGTLPEGFMAYCQHDWRSSFDGGEKRSADNRAHDRTERRASFLHAWILSDNV